MSPRSAAEAIFRHAVDAVRPERLIPQHVSVHGNSLHLAGQSIPLDSIEHIYVVGAGKATAPMAHAVETILDDRITDGVIIVKYGHGVPLPRIRTVEAAHPVPDENGVAGTQQLIQLLERTNENDLVIALFSGGASALLTDLPPGGSLADLQAFSDQLLKSGADIRELNTVRKHLSGVKGGHLARRAYPARMCSLILSDVIGDAPDVIASGPTVPDESTFSDAWQVVQKYHLEPAMPDSLRRHLQRGVAGDIPDTPKRGDPVFARTTYRIIGSNAIALDAAAAYARQLGFHPEIVSHTISGDAHRAAAALVTAAQRTATDASHPKPACLLMGGETTVRVTGNGLGGRNQELALAAARRLADVPNVTILSGGTDGTDGPTDAAGAIVDQQIIQRANELGLSVDDYLQANDSYHFFRQVGGHLITGPTRTNVMDIMLALVR